MRFRTVIRVFMVLFSISMMVHVTSSLLLLESGRVSVWWVDIVYFLWGGGGKILAPGNVPVRNTELIMRENAEDSFNVHVLWNSLLSTKRVWPPRIVINRNTRWSDILFGRVHKCQKTDRTQESERESGWSWGGGNRLESLAFTSKDGGIWDIRRNNERKPQLLRKEGSVTWKTLNRGEKWWVRANVSKPIMKTHCSKR